MCHVHEHFRQLLRKMSALEGVCLLIYWLFVWAIDLPVIKSEISSL